MSDEIKGAIRRVLRMPAGRPISDDDRIMDDLGADSLDGIEIVLEVEERCDVMIPDRFVEDIVKVGDLREAVEKARES